MKGEGGVKLPPPLPRKTTLKKPTLRVKNLPVISPTKLEKQLHHILVKMFKKFVTTCCEIKNQTQYKTKEPQKRCHQKAQHTRIKSVRR